MAINKLIILLVAFLTITLNLEAQNRLVNYLPDTLTNFPNPERGFAPVIDPRFPAKVTWKDKSCEGYDFTEWTEPVKAENLIEWKSKGYTVVMIRYHIAEFRFSELSPAFLDRLNNDFALIREYGFKLLPRFTYNWPRGGPDAPLEIVLNHIKQLKPVFKKNVDVTLMVDMGFIGCWGEQHHSCYGLLDGIFYPNINTWKILEALFEAVPTERMITLRYPFWKFRYHGNENDIPTAPLTEAEAYTGTIKSRWAHNDDCLVCGEWNVGTWNTTRNNAQEIIQFLSEDNHYVFQGGEPGDPSTSKSATDQDKDGYVLPYHTSCERMRWILEKEHWSIMNASYGGRFNNRAYQAWIDGGCYDEIALNLGYRLRLVNAEIPIKVNKGKVFKMSVTIHNDGWSSPHNPRGLEILLRNRKSGKITNMVIADGRKIPANSKEDPRFWLADEKVTIEIERKLPDNIEPGEYDVLMNLPDPAVSLYTRPEYSIRLANSNIWEPESGYNVLYKGMKIKN